MIDDRERGRILGLSATEFDAELEKASDELTRLADEAVEAGEWPVDMESDEYGRLYHWVACDGCGGRGSFATGCDYCRWCGGEGGERKYLLDENGKYRRAGR